jgi:thiamine pyrophosphate-dependent acetolactate synthase large subunit-like protein
VPGFASAVLGPAGVHTLYGSASSGLPVVSADERIARVLAEAHRAVLNRPAAAVTAGGSLLEVPGLSGDEPDEVTVRTGHDPEELVAAIRSALTRGGLLMRLDMDSDAGYRHWPTADEVADTMPDSAASLESDAAARVKAAAARVDGTESVVVLAGPGVVRANCVPGLHALAGALGAGVLNTWGAKGVFHWQSRHHWATIGLQEHDFALGGLGDAGLIVATGVDDREAPRRYWRGRPHVVVEPEDLDVLAEVVTSRRHNLIEMPPLRTRLAAATQAGWTSTAAPLAPSQATLAYGRRLAGGGLVAADAGMAGFWVARTFATTELGGVVVPAEVVPGWAAACVTVARMAAPLRPALAVVSETVDGATSLVLELATSYGIAVGVEVWSEGGEALDAEQHRSRLGVLTDPAAGGVGTIATDSDQVDAFVKAAGPLRPWRPLRRAARTS